jgi:hypothetical protein
MAYPYTSAYLLKFLLRLIGRPAADSISQAAYYERLTDAQTLIVTDIAAICPQVLYPAVAYGSVPTLTTTDNQLFTFGTDSNGFARTPMGKVRIYRSLNDIPTNPLQEGVDYQSVGQTAIRTLNNTVIMDTLYWVGISPPGVIDATHDPALFPEGSRQLIAYRAAIAFLLEANRNPALAQAYMALYGRPFGLNPGMFAVQCLEWRTQYAGGGVLGSVSGLQVAVGSSYNYP